MADANERVCLITGVGPGTGAALARRFVEGYRVAMLARNAERLAELEKELPGARGYPCDVTETEKLSAVLDRVRSELGAPEILIHNAVGGAFGDFLAIDPALLERNFQVNTMALLHLAQMTNLVHQLVESLVEARVVAQEPGELDLLELDDYRQGLFRDAVGSRAGIFFRRPGKFVSIPERLPARPVFARLPSFRTPLFVRVDGGSNRFVRVDEEPAGALKTLGLSAPYAHPQGVGADPQPHRGRGQGECRSPWLFGSVHDRTISRGRGESEAICGRRATGRLSRPVGPG